MILDESRLILPNRPDSLKPLLAFAREKAGGLGYSEQGQGEIELALEEAATNVIEHAYEPGEKGHYEVTFARLPGRLLLSIEDRGRRFGLGEEGGSFGLGFRLMKAFAQEVRFISLGERGKRLEIYKALPARNFMEAPGSRQDSVLPPGPAPNTVVEVRTARPEDAPALSRFVYDTCGWNDEREFLYHPDRLREMIAAGLVEACVAAEPRGFVGMWAFLRDPRVSPVALAGGVILAPGFSEGHIAEDMVFHLLERARAGGSPGLLCESSGRQPFLSSMAVLPFSACETGVLLGRAEGLAAAPAGSGEGVPARAGLIEYAKLADGASREVYPPFHHATMLRKIYDRCRLSREFGKPSPGDPRLQAPQSGRAEVRLLPAAGQALIIVQEYGKDLLDRLYRLVEDLDKGEVTCVHLDLPLGDPRTASFVASAEALGFSLAGVLPEQFEGDVLRLQHIGMALDGRPDLPPATEFGEDLLDYVWKGYKN